MSWHLMKYTLEDGTLYTSGVDWGRPLKVQYQKGPFIFVSRAGYMAWSSRGAQEYAPGELMLFAVQGDRVAVMLELTPGRKVAAAKAELRKLTDAWFDHLGVKRQHQLVCKGNTLTCGEHSLEIAPDGIPWRSVVNFFVRAGIAPWDVLTVKGRMNKVVQRAFRAGYEHLELVLGEVKKG